MIYMLEDDANIRNFVLYALNNSGLEAKGFERPSEFWAALKEETPSVLLLDIMLPEEDGMQVLAKLRSNPEYAGLPVIMLTAKGSEYDKVIGLDSGADDYMTKPFAPAELLAHLRALTRRQGEVLFEKLAAGDLVLNLESYDLACGSKSIHLSYKEFSLAKVLMANAGQVVSKDMLIAKVWGVESSAEDNNVEAYVSFLRKKMKFLGSTARIETLRRAGYRFVADAAPDDASESAGLPC